MFLFMEPDQITRAETAITDLLAHVRELIERRSQAPADDPMMALIRAGHDGDRLTDAAAPWAEIED
ncbi:hypothetical protein KF840_18400 [bacterium]|nr:hypothetical protein [bacterium]